MRESIHMILYKNIGSIQTECGGVPILDEKNATNEIFHKVEKWLAEFAVWLKKSPYEILEYDGEHNDIIWGNIWDEKDCGYSTEGIVELFIEQKIKIA